MIIIIYDKYSWFKMYMCTFYKELIRFAEIYKDLHPQYLRNRKYFSKLNYVLP